MKKLALVASLVLFAACAPKADEAAPAAAAVATTDSAVMADTTMKDSTVAAPAADTTKH